MLVLQGPLNIQKVLLAFGSLKMSSLRFKCRSYLRFDFFLCQFALSTLVNAECFGELGQNGQGVVR